MKIKLKPADHDESKSSSDYDVPEGEYRVVFVKFKYELDEDGCLVKVRVTWEVVFPNKRDNRYRAKKDYFFEGGYSEKLESDLKRMFGEDLSQFEDGSGNLDDYKILGKEADVEIIHKHTPGYTKPLVIVNKLLPVGTFKF